MEISTKIVQIKAIQNGQKNYFLLQTSVVQ